MLDCSPGAPGKVSLVTRTLTAAAMYEATSLVLCASVLPEQSRRPFGTTGNLDHIQKPGSRW